MAKQLTYWLEHRILNDFQDAFGKMIVRRSNLPDKDILQEGSDAEALYLLAGAVLRAAEDSNSCLELNAWKDEVTLGFKTDNQPVALEERLTTWLAKIPALQTDALAVIDSNCGVVNATQPLVLRTDTPLRAYLNRYYLYEKNIGNKVKALTGLGTPSLPESLNQQINKTNFQNKDEHQTAAIRNAMRHDFAIITGGPGRGKTTVLTELLAFRMMEFLECQGHPMRVALCAPTGKASARMKESIKTAIEMMSDEGKPFFKNILKELGQLRPYTLHKLLGINKNSDYPKHNATNPLEYDLIAVDECSMMDLKLFNDLVMAMKPETKLILLGDENQLQSVAEGKVLAELCANLPKDSIVSKLVTNFRSKANEALCNYTDALIAGTADTTKLYSGLVATNGQGYFQGFELPPKKDLEEKLRDILKTLGILDAQGKSAIKKSTSAEEALGNLNTFKVLTAVNEGHYGVDGLNAIMRKLLGLKQPYETGVPIIIKKNDDVTGLRNGDIGVCFGKLVYFSELDENGKTTFKGYTPAQLPPHDCAFAMTIHKSQGSDYDSVLMVLPDKDMPLLTRELVYTGMTRAKKNFFLLANTDILQEAQKRRTIRWSGLEKWLE